MDLDFEDNSIFGAGCGCTVSDRPGGHSVDLPWCVLFYVLLQAFLICTVQSGNL